MRKQIQTWALASVACMSFCCSSILAQDQAASSLLTIGSKAPALDVEHWISDGKGKFKPVKQFESGHVYIVEFWATWCGPCIASMPHLAETQAAYADKKVQFVSISDEDMPTIEEFLKQEVPSKDEKTKTYAELTSAYCLTTDPDRSVYGEYMDAAGQEGIPTAFIVGKSGLIEWIGHPMEMDEPLKQVVEDSWNREVFLAKFKAEQERAILMSKIAEFMQENKVDDALAFIAKTKEEAKGDQARIDMLDMLSIQVQLSVAARKIQSGTDVKAALAEIDAIAKTAAPKLQTQIQLGKCRLVLMMALNLGEHFDLAAQSLNDLAEAKEVDAEMLNMLSWSVYEQSEGDEAFSKELLAAATKLAERAVKEAPDRGDVIDTLAHLVHVQGNLDRAIELQTEAVKKSNEQVKEVTEAFLKELQTEKENSAKK